ncbi:ASG_G0052880.mRNA.1.CDS.1 [Saccharomyces cerevisiae]|uniref:EC1118_1O4_6612p n=2 Tax=Saccharomycetaceae TaxID=4893 RepID=C8ZHF1_YEAS8|nr:hypothetical protein QA23_5135 [Saccharomyces cerevisiae Lalvin QA23]EWG87944.1 hypothetical protein P301_O30031 [Saccharomyces cerevisiae P301]CAI4508505.1 AFI_G0022730.mRNA.1.CDS.1 [Saccharomyces cerevisiae]CAY86680.1 EC1118_1O4_6612p [Saccharomyces cerevisiae EC1118]CEP25286.1 conserved hypothetical protein [Torulaspora microellipsoides]
MDLFSMKGKIASVTGASGGIGYEIAIGFAQAGADVAMWYNTNPSIEKEVEGLSMKYGVKVKAYQCALTDGAKVAQTIKKIENDFGKIDIMIANAGIAWASGPLVDFAEKDSEKCDAEWMKIMDVDVNSVYYVSKSIGSIFKKQGYGSLVITASMSGHIANIPQLQVAYNTAKAALIHMGRSLAIEWAGFARVNTVSPGYVETPIAATRPAELKKKWMTLVPMGRLSRPKEIVGAYLYLASDAASYTTGTDIIVDGGYCCA